MIQVNINMEFSSISQMLRELAGIEAGDTSPEFCEIADTEVNNIPEASVGQPPKKRGRKPKVVATPEVAVATEDTADAPAPEVSTVDATEDIISIDELRAALIRIADKVGPSQVSSLVGSFTGGSTKAADVPENKRKLLMEKIEALDANQAL